jgi:hypothetical protein
MNDLAWRYAKCDEMLELLQAGLQAWKNVSRT